MSKITKESVIPTLMTYRDMRFVLFSIDFNKEDTLLDDAQELLETFIKLAYQRYVDEYVVNIPLFNAVSRVSAEALASDILYLIQTSKNKGSARFTIKFGASFSENFISLESDSIAFTLHWFDDHESKVHYHFPIGFISLSTVKPTDKELIGNLVFDLRVIQNDIENSEDFYLNKVIPGLDAYFVEVAAIFNKVSGVNPNFNIKEIKEALCKAINDVYEERLVSTTDEVRHVLFLNSVFEFIQEKEFVLKILISSNTEMTTTPELRTWDSGYKAQLLKSDEVIVTIANIPGKVKDDQSGSAA